MTLIKIKTNSPYSTRNGRCYRSKLDDPAGFKNESSRLPENESLNKIQSVTEQIKEVKNGVVSQEPVHDSSSNMEVEIEPRTKRFSSRLYDY